MRVKRFSALLLCVILVLLTGSGCGGAGDESHTGLTVTDSLELSFATQFSVDHCEGGYKLITLQDGSRFLTVPEGKQPPQGLEKDIALLYQPIGNIYLAATAAMCLFDSLDRLDAIRFSGAKEDGWYIENARKAMQDGDILYAGKYSAPDYELLTASGCPLAVESMMIGHASDIKDQLETLGIAVLVDQSSNEPHPLGRAEWIKLYGALLDEEEKAQEVFDRQVDYLNSVADEESTGKTVAFFFVSSGGKIIARKSGDYVSKMIELAGGKYVFDDLGDDTTKTSTVTLEPEYFYLTAKDADVIIYNAAIADEVTTIDALCEKCELLKDCKAVKNGDVWCTGKSMYQETTDAGEMIKSLHDIFADESGKLTELPYFYRLS